VLLWGKLAAPGYHGHQFLPRVLDEPRVQHLYIANAACGKTHYAFLADSLSSELLAAFEQYVTVSERASE